MTTVRQATKFGANVWFEGEMDGEDGKAGPFSVVHELLADKAFDLDAFVIDRARQAKRANGAAR